MEDYFKIVAVLKKKRIEYSYIPHQWEADGVLHWPQANLNNLRKNPCSSPLDDWKTYSCKVKKNFIYGLEEAELWEERFVDDGTDAESSVQPKVVPKIKDTNFDNIFEKLDLELEEQDPKFIIHYVFNPTDVGGNLFFPINESATSAGSTNPVTLIASGSSNNESEKNEIWDKLCEISNYIDKLEQRLNSKTISQDVMLDKIYKLLKGIGKNATAIETEEERTNKEDRSNASKFNFPLTTIEEVLDFNKELTRSDYFNYLIKTYSAIGGTDGNEEGKVVARKLRTIIFTEEVLCSFSWTGMSRTAGVEKKPFQVFEGILNFFLEIVKLADSRWNMTKNEKFFKNQTLKHANQIKLAVVKKKSKLETKKKDALEKDKDLGSLEINQDADSDQIQGKNGDEAENKQRENEEEADDSE